jgi:hypothetical protein
MAVDAGAALAALEAGDGEGTAANRASSGQLVQFLYLDFHFLTFKLNILQPWLIIAYLSGLVKTFFNEFQGNFEFSLYSD